MGSLVFEQNCVVKFLTLEKNTTANIYKRLKKIYQQNVLPLDDVIRLYQNFSGLTLPVTESISNKDVRYIKIEPLDTSLTIEDIHEPHIQVFEETDSLSQTPMKKRQLISATSEIISTKPGRAKRKASLKAKDTWENLKPSHNKFKQEVLNVIENYEQQEESDEIEYQMDMDYSFKGDEEDIEQVEEEEDDTEYAKGASFKSIKLPFLPRLKNTTPLAIMVAQLPPGSFDCQLCEDSKHTRLSRLKRHLMSVHIKRSVQLDKQISLFCRLQCVNINNANVQSNSPIINKKIRSHYHCPLCTIQLKCPKKIFIHYQRHLIENERNKLKTCAPCPNTSICIDLKKGLYLVLRSLVLYTLEPIHVIWNNSEQICSETICTQSMNDARKNGIAVKCKHLKRIQPTELNMAPDFTFDNCQLDKFDLSPDQREQCLKIRDAAKKEDVPCVVCWKVSQEASYFSIYCIDSFDIFGRTIIKFQSKENEYACQCSNKEHFCPYKILTKIHINGQ